MLLNNYKGRKALWDKINKEFSTREIKKAIDELFPGTQRVIRLHYIERKALKDIAAMLARDYNGSITCVAWYVSTV